MELPNQQAGCYTRVSHVKRSRTRTPYATVSNTEQAVSLTHETDSDKLGLLNDPKCASLEPDM